MLDGIRKNIRLKLLGTSEIVDETPSLDFLELTRRIAQTAQERRTGGYLRFPMFVHLETLAVCNAACEFCPYPTLERKGTRMSDESIEKILRDLADGPKDLPFLIAPFKVSDPFLEARLFDVMDLALTRLPNLRIALITNGSGLTDSKIERLASFDRIHYLTVSLNFDDPTEYERVMGLPFARTLERLDALHARAGSFSFPVRLSRVSVDRSSDQRFLEFARARYPSFHAFALPRNDWIGEVITPGANARVPDAPCHRWFDMSITATGEVAMCCMDGEAQYSKGNALENHVLELYNQPHLLALREHLFSRRQVPAPCNQCTYLSG